MADTIATKKAPEVDKSNWEWVSIPAKDLFGDTHTGISINFEKFVPHQNEDGSYSGKEGRYFVDPVKAEEIRRILALTLVSQMRVMQPQQDQKLMEILRKGGKALPNQINQ